MASVTDGEPTRRGVGMGQLRLSPNLSAGEVSVAYVLPQNTQTAERVVYNS